MTLFHPRARIPHRGLSLQAHEIGINPLALGEDSIANYLSTNCCRFYLFALSTTTVINLFVCLTAGASPSAPGSGSHTFA